MEWSTGDACWVIVRATQWYAYGVRAAEVLHVYDHGRRVSIRWADDRTQAILGPERLFADQAAARWLAEMCTSRSELVVEQLATISNRLNNLQSAVRELRALATIPRAIGLDAKVHITGYAADSVRDLPAALTQLREECEQLMTDCLDIQERRR